MTRVLGLFNSLIREIVEMHYLFTTRVLMEVRKATYEDGLRFSLEAAKRANMERAA